MQHEVLTDYIGKDFYTGLPVYPYVNLDKAGQSKVYGPNIFEKLLEGGANWEQFTKLCREFKRLQKQHPEPGRNDSYDYLVYGNTRFIFMITDGGTFYVWDESKQALGDFYLGKDYEEKVITKDFVTWLTDLLADYCSGFIRCSDCGKKLQKSEIAGRYFAGSYCKTCWDREWKARAENETHD